MVVNCTHTHTRTCTHALTLQDQITLLQGFARRVERAAVQSMKDDITYGEVPDEFKGQ